MASILASSQYHMNQSLRRDAVMLSEHCQSFGPVPCKLKRARGYSRGYHVLVYLERKSIRHSGTLALVRKKRQSVRRRLPCQWPPVETPLPAGRGVPAHFEKVHAGRRAVGLAMVAWRESRACRHSTAAFWLRGLRRGPEERTARQTARQLCLPDVSGDSRLRRSRAQAVCRLRRK